VLKSPVTRIAMLLLCLSGSAFAQQDARLDAALKLLDSMDMRESLARTIEQATEIEMENAPNLRPFREIMLGFLNKHMGYDNIRLDFARLYADNFSESELNQLADFYRTPVGRKSIERLPELTAQGARLGQRKVQENSAELEQLIKDEINRTQAQSGR
jgi:uncharacterized protein